MTGEFSTLAHMIAPARLARPGPSVPMAQPRLAGHPRDGLCHEAGGLLVVWRDDLPAALLGGVEHVDEVRVWDAEERVDALSLEQLQDSFVNLDGHCGISPFSLLSRSPDDPDSRVGR